MGRPITLKAYKSEYKKILVERTFFPQDQTYNDNRIFSYAINCLEWQSGVEASHKYLNSLNKTLRKQSNFLLIQYFVKLFQLQDYQLLIQIHFQVLEILVFVFFQNHQ